MGNPLANVNQMLISGAGALACLLIWKYRSRFLFLLTGDDRLHINCLDLLWFWCCRCAGCCDGEWTRHFMPGHINAKKELGRWLGVLSRPICVSNIVAGNIPGYSSGGDFYLGVECGDNPPMYTSITESANGIVVHFDGVITLSIRDSAIADRCRFVVKELNILGSNEVCELWLNPQRIAGWAEKHPGRIMRFQMDPMSRGEDLRTPPWLALQFGRLTEFRGKQNNTVHTTNTHTAVMETMGTKNFKMKYRLIKNTGDRAEEPEDVSEELQQYALKLARYRRAATYLITLICMIIIFRLWLYKCWKEFETAYYDNPTEVDNALAARGTQRDDPNYLHDAIIYMCYNPNIPRPMVFEKFAKAHMNGHSLPCFKGCCWIREKFVEYRPVWMGTVGAMGFLAFILCTCAGGKKPSNKKEEDSDDEEDQKGGPQARDVQSGKG